MAVKTKPQRSHGLAEAKARLSELVDKAQRQGPQQITRRGRTAAYLVSAEEWERLTKPQGTLLDFFKNSGLWGSGIDLAPPSY
ncbi:MAG TPA: type II toxin-antitoxin system Phd/YefM family antitoxin [Terriglobales bacterium]|nr:type II toxin-antitoxin system Phd/YefM family antitoxin [Terriglobales bacterium]